MGRLYLPFFACIRVDRGLKVSALAVHFSYIFFFPPEMLAATQAGSELNW